MAWRAIGVEEKADNDQPDRIRVQEVEVDYRYLDVGHHSRSARTGSTTKTAIHSVGDWWRFHRS